MEIGEKVVIEAGVLKRKQVETVKLWFGHLQSSGERIYIIDELYPLQRTQPDLGDFPMLKKAGIAYWGQIADLDKVVRWKDVYYFLEFLYLKYPSDFQITITTLNEFVDLLFELGYSGFYCR